MKITVFFTIFLLLICVDYASAQKIEDINPDRPDQSESPDPMYLKFIQIESGIKLYRYSPNPDNSDYTLSVPEVLIRYGLFRNLEVRLGVEYSYDRSKADGTGNTGAEDSGPISYHGFQPPELSIKYMFLEGDDYTPRAAVLLGSALPGLGAEKYRPKHFSPELKLALYNELSDKFDVTYNLGLSWDNEAKTRTWFYTVSAGYTPVRVASFFLEVFSNLRDGTNPDHNLDFGFAYLLRQNMQADVYCGTQLKSKPDVFFGGGFSIRLPK